jgi:predicted permease
VLAGRNYDTAHVALMRVRPRLIKYPPDQAQRFQREVIRQLRELPTVESVSMVGIGTILGGGSTTAGLPAGSDRQQVTVQYNEIGPAYFATLRTPLLRGREFDDRDTAQSPAVAIVNDTLARRFWPDGQAMGSMIVVGATARQVVGVVADVSLNSRSERAESWVYTPFWQNPGEIDSRIAVRTAGNPAAVLAELSRTVHRVDPNVPIAETITLPVRIAALTRPVRVSALFVGYAAVLAVLLTAIGLYSTLAFAVSRRTKEIGIRLALGAGRGRVIRSIVREGVNVALVGGALGVLLAFGASRVLSHLLYGSAEADWMFFATAALVIGCVALGASLVPARRAARVEPIVALRHE